jgi:aspartyl/asparaginyl beta-hydroxylase (cupin superfamily)
MAGRMQGGGGEAGGEGAEEAANRAIEAEPYSVPAHVLKGDCRAAAGDRDLACYFYARAIELAELQGLAPSTPEVERAARILRELQEQAHREREACLASRGLPPDAWSPRLRQSLEVAAGRRKLYRQQPTAFDYPGLPHVQFYERSEFGWAAAVEAAAPAIRDELLALLAEGADSFRPYIQSDTGSIPLRDNKALLNSRDWSVLPICEQGWLAPDLVAKCPRTLEAVLQAPVPRVSGWGPTIVFSMLKAGARIAPHTGMFNARLICHLPLVVPPNCRFRVGNEVREWEEGKLLIFDDTIEHEAWNESDEDRIVLIFDIWRPELSERERHELTALFSD